MKNYKLHVSEGFKDTYGNEMLVKKEIEARVLNVFESYGYELIKTPTLEYIDVYSLDGMQKPDLYNLINRQGEVLALCNDMTASIARFVCSNNSLALGAKKYCYIADTFRYPRLYQGKNHQFLQAGVEFIGAKGLEADIATIALAYETMRHCNVCDFTIHLGSSSFLSQLFKDFGIEEESRKEIYSLIDSKDYVTLRGLLSKTLNEDKASFLIDLMLKCGRLKYLENLIKELDGMSSLNELLYLKDLYNQLNALGISNIIFDFSIYSYAEYYTGIIFSFYVEGAKKSVISGGRCDKLFKHYGKDLEDIGFGLDIDVLASYCLSNHLIDVTHKKYLSISDKESFILEHKENIHLREKGIIVSEVKFESIELALDYAKENGFDAVIEYKNLESKLWEVEKC